MVCKNCGEQGISTELCKACVAAGVTLVDGVVTFKIDKSVANKKKKKK